ncbi:MAG: CARDB domain-containing protein [Candidatus Undinarchaeales archaeon]|jgi:hypothetical protein|nr:CARDB domain-containing protein [Candidatus Undinarchaeales archaeon]MDP7492223.1 CARDB domain-containing protein [Candidatus Undinarchaeales archaeon]
MMYESHTHGHDGRRGAQALILAALLVVSLACGQTQGTQTVWAQFDDLRFSPAQVRPGQPFTLSFDVRNILDVEMEDMHLELSVTGPFDDLGASYVYIGDMRPNATAPASFRLQVDEDTPAGVYPLTVIVSMEATAQAVQGTRFLEMKTTGYSFTKLINVRVHGEPEVVGAVAAGDLRDIHPGDRFTASLRLVNNGTDIAEDLRITAQNTDKLSAEWGFADQFVGDLPPGAAAAITLVGTIDEGAGTGEHALPLTLSWAGDADTYSSTMEVVVDVRPAQPVIAVSGVSSLPAVVIPGGPFSLTVRVVNSATDPADAAEGITLSLGPTNQVRVDASGREQVLGTLPGNAAITAAFTGEVLRNAKQGEHSLPLTITWTRDGRTQQLASTVLLGVAPPSPSLSVSAVGSQPPSLRPGEPFTVTLRVVNIGAAPHHRALDVVASVASTDALSFHAAGREQGLGILQPGGVATATVAGEVDDNATAGDHTVPVKLVHRSGTVEGTITLTIAEVADFAIRGRNRPLLRDDTRQPVTFVVRNTGTTTAEQVSLTLMASYPITPAGRTAYIPRLPPGEREEVVFHVDVDAEATPQSYPLEVVIAWQEGSERTRRQQTDMVALEVSPFKPRFRWEIPLGIALVVLAIVRLKMRRGSKSGEKKAPEDIASAKDVSGPVEVKDNSPQRKKKGKKGRT